MLDGSTFNLIHLFVIKKEFNSENVAVVTVGAHEVSLS
jgi:hypothetical protein